MTPKKNTPWIAIENEIHCDEFIVAECSSSKRASQIVQCVNEREALKQSHKELLEAAEEFQRLIDENKIMFNPEIKQGKDFSLDEALENQKRLTDYKNVVINFHKAIQNAKEVEK